MNNTLHTLKYLAVCLLAFCLALLFVLPVAAYEAPRADIAPSIDGKMNDTAWKQAEWQRIDHFILGEATNQEDFSGRFKIVWTPERLFVLALISDDVLLDRTADPLERYWEDDLFEILLDEDASGGPHHTSYNAFAYHISPIRSSISAKMECRVYSTIMWIAGGVGVLNLTILWSGKRA